MRRQFTIAVSIFVAAASTMAGWNFAITQWRLARNVPPGQFYVVDGSRMYIHCVGTGTPAVVIESGLSSDSFGWYGVQQTLAKTTRVCAYDRPGLGFSDLRSDTRDAEHIARQLRDLLDRAGVVRPFVGVGWSAGGLYLREYARQFPTDLAGLALIESVIPRQLDVLPGARASYEADSRTLPTQFWTERLRVWTGWERLRGRCWNEPAQDVIDAISTEEAERFRGLYVAKTCRPAFVGGELGEFLAFESSVIQGDRLRSLGDMPLLIVSEDPSRRVGSPDASIWSEAHEAFKGLSRRSWRVIARGAGHAVHHDRPDLLVAQVGALISYLRGGPSPQFGQTITQ